MPFRSHPATLQPGGAFRFRGAQPTQGPRTCSGTGDGGSWAPLRSDKQAGLCGNWHTNLRVRAEGARGKAASRKHEPSSA